LFSTTTGWPSRSFSLSAMTRPMTSMELPAGADYEIWNMHPTEPVLRGALPRWRLTATWA